MHRCVNADPNYGSVWFHCRDQPYDMPSTVLRSALQRLVHEISATQKIYARALFHFVRRCLLQPSGDAAQGSPSRSFSSLTVRKNTPLVNAVDKGAHGLSSSLNGLPSPSRGPLSGGELNSSLLAAGGDQADTSVATQGGGKDDFLTRRAREVLEDIAAVEGSLVARGWPGFSEAHLVPFVEVDGGALFSSADFVTCMIEMNRNMFDPALALEAKRKHLFGSDQVAT